MNNYFCIGALIIFLVVFGMIIYLLTRNNRKITYYKCPQKPVMNLLQDIFDQNRIKSNKEDFDLFIPCGYNFVEKELSEIIVPKGRYIFGLKGCDKIVSKNNLWNLLVLAFNKSGASRIMPETYLIQNVNEYDVANQKISQGKVLICKKNIQRKQGLKLVMNHFELKDARDQDFKLAQIFFTDTLQINQRKLNMRVYYVIKKVGKKLEFFVNNNGKVLYTAEKTTGPIRFQSHITSFQMDPEIYKKENLPFDFKALKTYLGDERYRKIWNKIIEKIKFLSNAIAYSFNDDKFNDKVCFQLFGMDVIINGDDPYILEINKGPDMVPKSDNDKLLKKGIFEEMFNLVGILKSRRNNFVKVYSVTF